MGYVAAYRSSDGVREHDRRVQQEVGRRVQQDVDDLSSGLRRML